jgi:hypothetical protein
MGVIVELSEMNLAREASVVYPARPQTVPVKEIPYAHIDRPDSDDVQIYC